MRKTSKQRSLFPEKGGSDLFFFERRASLKGYNCIAGVDEAGRGPLAGPVVAASVVLKAGDVIEGLTDSKKLSPSKREALFEEINARALAVGVGVSDAEEIDRINILQATLISMQRAIKNMSLQPDCLLIDGISPLPLPIYQETIKKGDSLSFSIAAASIIAKVTRDRMMDKYDAEFPLYGFSSHKGYGAKSHMSAIAAHGPSPVHRKTFRGVKEYVL